MPHGRLALLALALAAALASLARAAYGVTLGSDAYSYLVWAREAVDQGFFDHSRYDYTVPKPLELLMATIGQVIGFPLGFFALWNMLGLVAAVGAAAALGGRLSSRRGALLAGIFALSVPVLWRGALSGDANVPYAACVVGAAAFGAGRPGASALLALGGLLRPEAWGLAALSAGLGWRTSTARERVMAIAATVVPPIVWFSIDRAFTGEWLYSSNVLDRYAEEVDPFSVSTKFLHRIDVLYGWPLIVLGFIALGIGLSRLRLDAAVVFPCALGAVAIYEIASGRITADSIGRMLTALALFAAVGAGALLARVRSEAVAAVVLAGSLVVMVGPLADVSKGARDDGSRARELDDAIAPATRQALAGGGLVVTDRGWQGALTIYTGLERRRVVPYLALGRGLDRARARAFLVERRKPRQEARRGTRLTVQGRWFSLWTRPR